MMQEFLLPCRCCWRQRGTVSSLHRTGMRPSVWRIWSTRSHCYRLDDASARWRWLLSASQGEQGHGSHSHRNADGGGSPCASTASLERTAEETNVGSLSYWGNPRSSRALKWKSVFLSIAVIRGQRYSPHIVERQAIQIFTRSPCGKAADMAKWPAIAVERSLIDAGVP